MQTKDASDEMLQVWCPLVPSRKLGRLSHHIVELERVNERYDDWKASMRTKRIVNVHVGVLLDRIRMLLMGIGIACASNHKLSDSLQSIISECLRTSCLLSLGRVKEGKHPDVVKTTEAFLRSIRWTRDIWPEEEIKKAYAEEGLTGNPDKVLNATLNLSSTIVKAVYLRLLSPDPWQDIENEC